MMVEATNRLTGEVISYEAETREQLLLAYDEVHAQIDALKQIKGALHLRAVQLLKEEHTE